MDKSLSFVGFDHHVKYSRSRVSVSDGARTRCNVINTLKTFIDVKSLNPDSTCSQKAIGLQSHCA